MRPRTTLSLLAPFVPFTLAAQLTNANFEQELTGWMSPCAEQAALSTDVPPAGGAYSLQVRARNVDSQPCFGPEGDLDLPDIFVYQPLPAATNGTVVTVTYTSKLVIEVPDPIGAGTRCDLIAILPDGTIQHIQQSQAGSHTSWNSAVINFTVPVLPSGAVAAVAFSSFFMTSGQGHVLVDNVMTSITGTGATLNAKVWLSGPYVPAQGLMRDDLRANGYIPSSDPFPLNPLPGTIPAGALSVTGPNAIVDWLRIELRHTVAGVGWQIRVNALLQRDGDIVALDGVSPVAFPVKAGNYQLVVRHRNHLPFMTEQAVAISSNSPMVDLRSTATALYTRPTTNTDLPAKVVGNQQFMWPGNTELDLQVAYIGTWNDRDRVLQAIGGTVPTNTLAGYHDADVNLDGLVKYIGADNDRDLILQTIGGTVPTAVRRAQVDH